MKNTITSLLALVVISLIQVSLSAMPVDGETFEASLLVSGEDQILAPTYSKGVLKQYALKNVTRGYMSVSVKHGENFQRTFIAETPQEIIDQMMNHEISIKTTHPEDEEVDIHIYLQGSDQATYFSGSSNNIVLKEENGQWGFELTSITLVLQENIKMPIPEVVGDLEFAEIRVRDENGYIRQITNLWPNGRSIYFPTRHAGQFGEIVFTDSKGQDFIYDLGTGKRMTEDHFEIYKSVNIDNYREMSLSGGTRYDEWYTSLYTDDGTRRTAPVYYLKVTETTVFKVESYIYYKDEFGNSVSGKPDRAWLEKVGDSFEEEVFYDKGFEVELEPGEYYLRLEYELLEEPGFNAAPGKG